MTSLLTDTPASLPDVAPMTANPPTELRLRIDDALLGAHSADAYVERMHEVVDALAKRFTKGRTETIAATQGGAA